MKRERKKIAIKRDSEEISGIKLLMFLKTNMIKIETIIAAIIWGDFVNLKNLIII